MMIVIQWSWRSTSDDNGQFTSVDDGQLVMTMVS